jgi:hypothetical protein
MPGRRELLRGDVYQQWYLVSILREHAKDLKDEIAITRLIGQICRHNQALVDSLKEAASDEQG